MAMQLFTLIDKTFPIFVPIVYILYQKVSIFGKMLLHAGFATIHGKIKNKYCKKADEVNTSTFGCKPIPQKCDQRVFDEQNLLVNLCMQ